MNYSDLSDDLSYTIKDLSTQQGKDIVPLHIEVFLDKEGLNLKFSTFCKNCVGPKNLHYTYHGCVVSQRFGCDHLSELFDRNVGV